MPVFKSDTVSINHDIAIVYSPNSGNSIVTLVDNNPNFIKYKFGLESTKGNCNALLDELRCYATISSIPEVTFPDYSPDDTESERVIKTQTFEYGTTRFEATVYRKAADSIDWAEVGLVALKNAGGFRYRIHRLLDLLTDNIGVRMGEWGKIGIAIKSVGFGSPQIQDRISFTGSWVQEYTWTSELPSSVIVNNYGGSTSTPTPVANPTFALSITGSTATANNNDPITLTITNVTSGTQLTGSWYKGETELGITEPITVTGSTITLLTNKFLSKGSGQYKLKFTISGTTYETNAVSVTVSAYGTISINSGASFVENANSNPITITGQYFAAGSISYTWLLNDLATTLTGTITAASDGTFTVTNQTSSQFYNYGNSTGGNPSGGRGYWKLRLTQNSVNYSSNAIYAIDTMPTATLTPSSISIASGGNITAGINKFLVGDVLQFTLVKNGTDISSSTTDKTYAQNTGNAFAGYSYSYTIPVSQLSASPYGAGTYKMKIQFQGATVYSPEITVAA